MKTGLFVVHLFDWNVSAYDIQAIALQNVYEIIVLCRKSKKPNATSA